MVRRSCGTGLALLRREANALDHFSRREARKRVALLGALVISSVSRETDSVVVGKGPGQKLGAAREQGVQTLTESQFIALLREAGGQTQRKEVEHGVATV
jgi:BRCT domain type II-containing protein